MRLANTPRVHAKGLEPARLLEVPWRLFAERGKAGMTFTTVRPPELGPRGQQPTRKPQPGNAPLTLTWGPAKIFHVERSVSFASYPEKNIDVAAGAPQTM